MNCRNMQVTCGGLQSAHTAAVAALAAEHGMRAHLLVRIVSGASTATYSMHAATEIVSDACLMTCGWLGGEMQLHGCRHVGSGQPCRQGTT